MADEPIQSDQERAWADFTVSGWRLGLCLLALPPFPTGERATAEGYRYLGRLIVTGLQWAIEFGDPDFPAFYRHDDDVTKWGGPNVDNTYLRARVRAGNSYRIVGNGATTHGFLISTHEGDMQLAEYGVYAEKWHDELATDPDGRFELIVSADHQPRKLDATAPRRPPTSRSASTSTTGPGRLPGKFRIERLGSEGQAPGPLSPLRAWRPVSREGGDWIEASLHYWNRYVDRAHAESGDNLLPTATIGSRRRQRHRLRLRSSSIWPTTYPFLIEGEPPSAWSWNIMLYNPGGWSRLDLGKTSDQFRRHPNPSRPRWPVPRGGRSPRPRRAELD